ncbi:holo-acyl-carrier-protein synthase [Diplocarpon rosae]|nr:holo-acyl-carrier-protein synthase [Diplocarpon rosae]
MPPMRTPKPFPLALNIGTDISSISRIRKILSGRHAQAFVRKILRKEEIAQSAGILGAVEEWHKLNSARKKKAERHSLLFGENGISEISKSQMGALGTPAKSTWEPSNGHEDNGIHVLEQHQGPFAGTWHRTSGSSAPDKESSPDDGPEAKDGSQPEVCVDTNQETETHDLDTAMQKCAQFLAGRFAAKEAAIKAYHSRRLTYHSVCILKSPAKESETGSTPPLAVVLSEQGALHDDLEGAKEVKISISHDGGFAVASCLAADDVASGEERMHGFAEAFRFQSADQKE